MGITWQIGDCQDLMREMEPDSIDLIVTDPPYGYSFMGKDWDKAVPSVDIWQECLRVLKPGAFAFIMSAPRQDVLAHNLVNLSDAGFETGFTSIYWTYASGFPKAGNIGKMVDKRLGIERKVIGVQRLTGNAGTSTKLKGGTYSAGICVNNTGVKIDITAPATPQAKSLDGSYGGFQPKPAVEVIMVAMKPLSKKTYVDQALANQKGITWLDDGRIPYQNEKNSTEERHQHKKNVDDTGIYGKFDTIDLSDKPSQGRFPANLLVSNDVLDDGNVTKSPGDYVRGSDSENQNSYSKGIRGTKGDIAHNFGDSGSFSRYFDLDAWWDERIKYLPKEARKTFPFMIVSKASKSEKGSTTHPTVKPLKLFSWLMAIGSQRGDLVLDPFLGSGTALEAGYLISRDVMGFEIDSQWEYLYSQRARKFQGNLGDWI